LWALALKREAILVTNKVEIEIATNRDLIAISFRKKLGLSTCSRALVEISLSVLEAMLVIGKLCKNSF
jgi:hypothetical protein